MDNIETVSIESLTYDPANARRHGKKNLEAIKGSLARFGQQKPIVVDRKGVVVAGNGTLEAARALNWTEIKIVRTELEGAEAMAFALADNRTAELAEWDVDVLGEQIKALAGHGFDVGSFGFDLGDYEIKEVSFTTGGKELNEEDFQKFEHQCPKCGFEWGQK